MSSHHKLGWIHWKGWWEGHAHHHLRRCPIHLLTVTLTIDVGRYWIRVMLVGKVLWWSIRRVWPFCMFEGIKRFIWWLLLLTRRDFRLLYHDISHLADRYRTLYINPLVLNHVLISQL